MPVTRSQKGMQRYEDDTTTETTATETTETSTSEQSGTSAQQSSSPDAASQPGHPMTLVPAGFTRHAASLPSSRAASRTASRASTQRRTQARENLAKAELQEAQAAARLAKIQLERELEEEDSAVEDENPEERNENIKQWIHASEQAKPTAEPPKSEGYAIAEAIKEALRTSAPQPKYVQELPIFEGDSTEWTAFRIVYEDTAPLFSSIHNMARLRKAIRGVAREAIKSLLYSEVKPEEIMAALRRRFGRPDALVLAELQKLKNLNKITENPRDICVFASQISNSVSAIQGLKRPQYLYSPEIVKIIIEKMPTILKFRWYDYSATQEEEAFSSITMMSSFLNKEADKCGAFALIEEPGVLKTANVWRRPRQATHNIVEKEEIQCPSCEGTHRLYDCPAFMKASTNERWDIVKKAKLCFKCLTGRHRKETCKRPPCKTCNRWHHRLLHEYKQETAPATAAVNMLRTPRALLKMIRVEVYGPAGSEKILALLDEGSTISLLDEGVAAKIGLQGPKNTLTIETIGGACTNTRDSMTVDVELRGIKQEGKSLLKSVKTIADLKLAPQQIEKSSLKACKHLYGLTNEIYYEAEAPKLLIGQDNWEYIVTLQVRKGKPGQPVASRTKLGWVLHGSDNSATALVHYTHTCAHTSAVEERIEQLVKDHFAIESLGVQPNKPSTDVEERALKILNETSRRLPDGRFEVGLLWKKENIKLPESYAPALKRFLGLERKMLNNAGLRNEYEAQIENLLVKKYAEEAPTECHSNKKWYLPHFPVIHPVKRKIRIVFDAAAKTNNICLNSALLAGPDLLQSLFGVLLRFRQGPVAIAADIKEMFLQVRILEQDRDSLRFLWRGNKEEKIKEYRMTSVVFGAISSPCTAIYIKNKNAQDFTDLYPEAARAVERNHYMDDYLQSFHDVDRCKQIIKQVDIIHKKAHFELRGWASNRPEVLEGSGVKEVQLGEEEKTLGLRWITESDEFGFRSQLRKIPAAVARGTQLPSKREVTGAVMSTFDPLGLLSPIVIQGKKLIQRIWRSGIGWDEEIKRQDVEHWREYLKNIEEVRNIRLPRCISPHATEGELHTFVDASETAYAAAVYWRTANGEVHLVAAKSRVTPLKPISVPRLELQAALLGSRLAASIENELDLKITEKTYWSDSSVVLSWIKTDPRTFKTFVAHRLAEIEERTRPHEWRWVPTSHNPADDATRKLPDGFTSRHRWFTGPDFLRLNKQEWPAPRTFRRESSADDKTSETVNTAREASTPTPERFSSWKKLLRSTARVVQFAELLKRKDTRKRKKGNYFLPLMPDHLARAEIWLMKNYQARSFAEEVKELSLGRPLSRQSKLRRIDVCLSDGVLTLRGRANITSGVSASFLNPIILEAKSDIGKLIIRHYHEKFNHGNHATVMNELRQKYWIIGLRSALRSLTKSCVTCRRWKGRPVEQPEGDLPAERVTHHKHPFTCTGVDYFGPMMVAVGRRREKRWGALFTCLTTRAIHLELVPSLTADSTIMALQRFAARRGLPKVLYSDNGTNFVGASKELQLAWKQLDKEKVEAEAEKIGVQWKFIPPGAPNMGGAWERLVRSVKVALDATLKTRVPREEVLNTLLLEAEHMINSRPITNLSDNLEEEALTPNHFLIGRSSGVARIGAFSDDKLIGRENWKTVQVLTDHLWKRWLREYLPTLLPRRINDGNNIAQLQPGDVVLIVDRTLPRNTWPRGIIHQVYPGPDGRTRIVDVTTKGGVLRRPASRIVPLVRAAESPNEEDGACARGGEC